MPQFEVRTDLAVEEKESFPGDGGEISGVALREWHPASGHMKLTEVRILNERGAKSMGKAEGTYLTLEAGQLTQPDED
ncbi:MAG: GPR endopeptidase, partial [Hungatella sp.]